ncbi:uncharacterized protein LOC132612934 [Lycium barbarum]|uniref:uncharacterized protein LOC132612934 n=1 Tax=Lycium barbarum TaxID=112863 RepID=UPI00293F3443|nr:uncharacterized protein LOC132612934 [Lycium barbarum]
MEVYIDDIVVKSLRAEDHLKFLQETFSTLKRYNMKLNPEKCAFGVGSGKFLRFMVPNRGIEINPDKIKAIEDISVINDIKGVQRLTRRIAALSRFISRSSNKSHRFFLLLKKKTDFAWTPKCQVALAELKRYPHLEKLALDSLSASRKLKPYFQSHPICVITSYPLRNVMHKPELSGRLAKRVVEISGYDIEYKPQTAIKSQILADFVVDFAPAMIPEVDKEMLLASGTSTGVWTLYTDGASNVKGSGLGIVLKPPSGDVIRQFIRSADLTNNEAEYEAMIAGLEPAKSLGAEIIKAKCDSLPVVNQANETFEVKDDRMRRYQEKLQVFLRRFKEWTLEHVSRDQNNEADALANLGSSVESDGFNSGAVVQLTKSVIETGHAEINSTSLTWDWRNKYIDYLQTGKLPSDAKESRALRTKAARFCLVDGQLYRRSFRAPLARCLGPGETDYVLREIHEGTCGNYSGADSLVRKLIRAGYYWNEMEEDARTFVRKCNECQKHAPSIH